jgi:hypothetical protein|tara:strand:- start:2628 stop:3347 length:720 start_codon:yes stop_codon:yes gene_type:complete
MPLPKLTAPTYELEVPSTGKKIKYRPFLVREEKILLLAMETEDEKQMADAVKTILQNCIQTSRFKVDNLSLFDIEYIFLNIRGKSIGEQVELTVTCPDDGESTVDVSIDLDDIKVQKSKEHTNILKLNDNISVVMKYPSVDLFIKNNMGSGQSSEVDDVFEIASLCIDQIVEGEDVYESSNFSKKELMEFLEGMDTKQFLMVQKFFETMPKLSHTITVTNPNTKVKSDVVIEGLSSFFS